MDSTTMTARVRGICLNLITLINVMDICVSTRLKNILSKPVKFAKSSLFHGFESIHNSPSMRK